MISQLHDVAQVVHGCCSMCAARMLSMHFGAASLMGAGPVSSMCDTQEAQAGHRLSLGCPGSRDALSTDSSVFL